MSKALIPQSTSEPPAGVGTHFTAGILKRERQLILVTRKYITSFTAATLVNSERKEDLKNGILKLLLHQLPLHSAATVRVDPGPGFKALVGDQLLKQREITFCVGRPKNPNKNPVA